MSEVKEINRRIGELLGYQFGDHGQRSDLVIGPDGNRVELPNWAYKLGDATELCTRLANERNWSLSIQTFDDLPDELSNSVGFFDILDLGFDHPENPTVYTVRWMREAYGKTLPLALCNLALSVLEEGNQHANKD
jgi:hypothetical protein